LTSYWKYDNIIYRGNKMGKKAFDEYIDTIQKNSADEDFYKKELDEWKQYLEVLYGKINNWMKDYVSKDIVQLKFKDKKIYEEFAGEYDIKALDLFLSGKTISFDPIGTMLVGAKGRVDVSGKNGKVSLVLVDKKLTGPNVQVKIFTSDKERKEYEESKKTTGPSKIEWEWKVLINQNQMQYVELNEDNFFDIVMELTNG
jgi:hypothetical protein